MIKQMMMCSVALAIAAPAVADQTVSVDCSRRTIGQALGHKAEKDKGALVVRVRGNCTEHVIIEHDDVTLEGDDGGATINGHVIVLDDHVLGAISPHAHHQRPLVLRLVAKRLADGASAAID